MSGTVPKLARQPKVLLEWADVIPCTLVIFVGNVIGNMIGCRLVHGSWEPFFGRGEDCLINTGNLEDKTAQLKGYVKGIVGTKTGPNSHNESIMSDPKVFSNFFEGVNSDNSVLTKGEDKTAIKFTDMRQLKDLCDAESTLRKSRVLTTPKYTITELYKRESYSEAWGIQYEGDPFAAPAENFATTSQFYWDLPRLRRDYLDTHVPSWKSRDKPVSSISE
ncbi:MAG: hypothetical protein M1828_007511 [Chrysothrix sp. TS-e1954]|nr:MAG: hypothetical protein M1828_007511 [Chrysothrix sp. TS-e1954]